MKYLVVILLALLLSGCDTIDKVENYQELSETIEKMQIENRELKNKLRSSKDKIQLADNQERNAKILKSLISNDQKHQVR